MEENKIKEKELGNLDCALKENTNYEDSFYIKKEKDILKLQKIDCLVKTLGTMVVIPEYDSDPNNIGQKIYKGPMQQPILKDGSVVRQNALEMLNKLIIEL